MPVFRPVDKKLSTALLNLPSILALLISPLDCLRRKITAVGAALLLHLRPPSKNRHG